MPRHATEYDARQSGLSFQPLDLTRPESDPEPYLPRNPVERRLARLVLQDIVEALRHRQAA